MSQALISFHSDFHFGQNIFWLKEGKRMSLLSFKRRRHCT